MADDKSTWAGLPRKSLKLALPMVAALGAGGAIAVAAIPDNTIHGCYQTSATDGSGFPSGNLRIADSSTHPCDSSEKAIDWNQQGPPGEPGPPGANGANGANGNNGADATTTPEKPPVEQAYLLLDGIPGGSKVPGHEKQVDVRSFSFGLSNNNDLNSSRERGNGKGTFQNLHFTKLHDRSSAKLFRMSGTGQHIKSAVFSVFKNGNEVIRYKLGEVLVKSYSTKDTPDGDVESIVFATTKVDLTFNDGGTSLSSSFDTRTQRKPLIRNFSFKTRSR